VRDGWVQRVRRVTWLSAMVLAGEGRKLLLLAALWREICSCAGGGPRAGAPPPGFSVFLHFTAESGGQGLALAALPQGLQLWEGWAASGLAMQDHGPAGGWSCFAPGRWRQHGRSYSRPD